MFITESYEQKKENDVIRIGIIRDIMGIYDLKSLKKIRNIVDVIMCREFKNHPMSIMDIAYMLDETDVVRVLDVVKHMDMIQIAARQMQEAFGSALDTYRGVEQDKNAEGGEEFHD